MQMHATNFRFLFRKVFKNWILLFPLAIPIKQIEVFGRTGKRSKGKKTFAMHRVKYYMLWGKGRWSSYLQVLNCLPAFLSRMSFSV